MTWHDLTDLFWRPILGLKVRSYNRPPMGQSWIHAGFKFGVDPLLYQYLTFTLIHSQLYWTSSWFGYWDWREVGSMQNTTLRLRCCCRGTSARELVSISYKQSSLQRWHPEFVRFPTKAQWIKLVLGVRVAWWSYKEWYTQNFNIPTLSFDLAVVEEVGELAALCVSDCNNNCEYQHNFIWLNLFSVQGDEIFSSCSILVGQGQGRLGNKKVVWIRNLRGVFSIYVACCLWLKSIRDHIQSRCC